MILEATQLPRMMLPGVLKLRSNSDMMTSRMTWSVELAPRLRLFGLLFGLFVTL